MSIIERALGKLQGGNPPEQRSAAGHIGSTLRQRETIVSVADPSRQRRNPRDSIEIDLNDLCAQGVTPPPEATDRLKEQIRRIKRPVLETVIEHTATSGASAASAVPPNLLMVTSSVAAEGKTYI